MPDNLYLCSQCPSIRVGCGMRMGYYDHLYLMINPLWVFMTPGCPLGYPFYKLYSLMQLHCLTIVYILKKIGNIVSFGDFIRRGVALNDCALGRWTTPLPHWAFTTLSPIRELALSIMTQAHHTTE